MNEALSARQTQILKSIVDEYINTAAPVGSLALEKKHSLGVSPATIRNEMGSLTNLGYLKQPHTSAGRVPTPKAMKFYISQLMDEKQLSVADEVRAKEEVRSAAKEDLYDLMNTATQALSQKTKSFTISTTSDGNVWSHGHAHVFNHPEFYNHQTCQSVFSILDKHSMMEELFFQRITGINPIEVLFGEEIGWDFFEPIGIVATQFQIGNKKGAIGIIGPYRLNYSSVIPTVRYFGDLISKYANRL